MRILVASVVDPAESRGGGWTVTRGLMKAIDMAYPGATIVCIPVRSLAPARHKLRQLTSLGSSLVLGGLPAKMRFTRTTEIRRGVSDALKAAVPDLVVLNGSDLVWMLPDLPSEVPVVVVAQNMEHALYTRQLDQLGKTTSLGRRLLSGDHRRLRERELAGMLDADGVIFLSEDDRADALRELPGISTVVIPPMFDYEPASRRTASGDRLELGMFADFTWWPNRVSLEWFLKDVWPAASAHCHLNLMGHGSEGLAPGLPNVSAHGRIAEARDAFSRCDLMIAPIIEGAGVKVKVAEALYNGVPMVATHFAIRGLPIPDGAAIVAWDSAEEWSAFLGSEAAWDLALRRVPAGAGEMFSLVRCAELLRDFIQRLQ